MSQSYCNLIYHIVFSTKGRQNLLYDRIRPRIHEYIGGAVRNANGVAIIVNGTADLVHILARLRQDQAISDILRNIKASTSGWIHRTFPDLATFAWQVGYGAFTVSASQIEKARLYIINQENHHKTMSFTEEFVALLDAHGIEYDAKYLWT